MLTPHTCCLHSYDFDISRIIPKSANQQDMRLRSVSATVLANAFPYLKVCSCCVQTMAQDCRKIFVVPSFVIILLGEIIMAIGGSGAGYQIMYFEVRLFRMHIH